MSLVRVGMGEMTMSPTVHFFWKYMILNVAKGDPQSVLLLRHLKEHCMQ